MSWYFFGGFSAYAMVPSGSTVNQSGCSVTHGWSGAHCSARSSATSNPCSRAAATNVSKSSMLPRPRWTASWPPSFLPMHLAERVDRRQAHHVETHLGDPRKTLRRGRERAVHWSALGIPPAGGPRKQLVPRTEPGQRTVDPHPVHLAAGQQFAQRVLLQP